MFSNLSPSDLELTVGDKRLLADTDIDAHQPCPILQDFEVLLNYVLTERPDVTTPLGWSLLRLLRDPFVEDVGLWPKLGEPARILPGELQPLFRPYFPEWQNNLQWPEHTFRDGLYIFQVALFKDVWRRIAIPATATLDTLSSAILNAFKFDHDHLDCFIYPTRIGLTEEVNHPYMDEGPFTSEVRIGDLPLQVGGSMVYNFDFGDNWLFDVKLEDIEAADPRLKKPKLLESHGQAPEQYPSYD